MEVHIHGCSDTVKHFYLYSRNISYSGSLTICVGIVSLNVVSGSICVGIVSSSVVSGCSK